MIIVYFSCKSCSPVITKNMPFQRNSIILCDTSFRILLCNKVDFNDSIIFIIYKFYLKFRLGKPVSYSMYWHSNIVTLVTHDAIINLGKIFLEKHFLLY